MNELIHKLAEHCESFGSWDNKTYTFNKQKFAELIVRECMEVCADRGKHHDGLYSAWASDCSERIGKRFGIE